MAITCEDNTNITKCEQRNSLRWRATHNNSLVVTFPPRFQLPASSQKSSGGPARWQGLLGGTEKKKTARRNRVPVKGLRKAWSYHITGDNEGEGRPDKFTTATAEVSTKLGRKRPAHHGPPNFFCFVCRTKVARGYAIGVVKNAGAKTSGIRVTGLRACAIPSAPARNKQQSARARTR